MSTRHFTRSLKKEVLNNPDLIENEDLKTQVDEIKNTGCRSVSECSTCIRFYAEHATFKEYTSKKRKRNISEFEQMKKEIESTAWIQCDNLSCRKWRRVPSDQIDNLAEKDWFCSLNKDTQFNSCHIPEEDTEKYDKMAVTVGLNYVKSEFWEGCLVWAKMPGYCSWPAVVTKSLETDEICERDKENNPVLYHVEYLGKTHTRGWIKRTSLQIFSEGRLEDKTQCKKAKKSGCENKGLKTTFRRGETVAEALTEAILFESLTPFQRLEKCVYKLIYIDDEEDSIPKPKERNPSNSKPNLDKSQTQKIVGNNNSNINDKTQKVNNNVPETTVFKSNLPEKNKISNSNLVPKIQSDNNTTTSGKLQEKNTENPKTLCEENKAHSNVQFNYDNCLLNKTKEERYCLDVEMYTKNEKAFEHDVLRFLMRNEVVYRGLPKLQNAPLTLFQIYLAVHERGGFTTVCKSRQWVSVCREVTNSQTVGGASVRLKSFYEKYLYPYELYIKGGDFASYIKDGKTKKPTTKTSKVTTTAAPLPSKDIPQTLIENNASPEIIPDNFELLSECSVDIQEMLDNLEKDESFCGLEDDVTAAKNKLGIDITFYDESPPIKQHITTPSEFDEADLPVESAAQEVPSVIDVYSNPMSDLDSQEEMIHEMQALQNGMELIDNFIEEL